MTSVSIQMIFALIQISYVSILMTYASIQMIFGLIQLTFVPI